MFTGILSAKHVAAVFVVLGVAPSLGKSQDSGKQPDQFHAGDRIALTVEGAPAIADTFTVQKGVVIQLPTIGDISLKGVRRSDSEAYLTQQIGQHMRNPVVHVVPLLLVALSGAISHPGYYSVPSHTLLDDVIMRIGGPTGEADLGRIVILRNGREVIKASQVNEGLTARKTLDDMKITAGDEIVVGERSRQNHLNTVLQLTYIVTGFTGLILALAHR